MTLRIDQASNDGFHAALPVNKVRWLKARGTERATALMKDVHNLYERSCKSQQVVIRTSCFEILIANSWNQLIQSNLLRCPEFICENSVIKMNEVYNNSKKSTAVELATDSLTSVISSVVNTNVH
ncbi:hypothetical protein PV325_011884 [Microctonus aethiopoides]|nr:hypothetical protein PV325_011884 [Microctonus aethiopoides]KAK0097523.1 hypothetical protein PV326_001366 [Microctonus aethiopoides]